MRAIKLAALLLILTLLLSGCRFAAVETDTIRVEAPTAVPAEE